MGFVFLFVFCCCSSCGVSFVLSVCLFVLLLLFWLVGCFVGFCCCRCCFVGCVGVFCFVLLVVSLLADLGSLACWPDNILPSST